MKIKPWLAAFALVLGSAGAERILAQQRSLVSADLEVLQIRPNFYLIAGAGANVAVQIGQDGVVIVDTGMSARADQVLAEIRKLTGQPIRYIINTSADPDHVGGNETLSAAGQSIIPTAGLNDIASAGGRAVIFAEEHVLARMSAPTGKQAPYPNGAWPTSSYSSALGEKQKDMYLNGEAIQVFAQPAAHTDGDSVVSSICRACGPIGSTRTLSHAAPARESATTWGCRSTTKPAPGRTRGRFPSRRCPSGSAFCTRASIS